MYLKHTHGLHVSYTVAGAAEEAAHLVCVDNPE